MYCWSNKRKCRHWNRQISISDPSLIVEISIFDPWNLHRWCNCKQRICWSNKRLCRHWNRQISISDPLKSASVSLRSAYLIVEICIADAIASNVFVDRLQYADTEIDKISISDPLKWASASFWSLRSAYLIVEICIADAIASNVFVDPEIEWSASLIRWHRHQHLSDCWDQHIFLLKAASMRQLQAMFITCVAHAYVRCAFHVLAGQGWVAWITDVGMHVAVVTTICGQWLCVAFVGVFDLTHEHLVMENCTHGVWHNSMFDIVCVQMVFTREHIACECIRKKFQRSNTLISTIREILLPISNIRDADLLISMPAHSFIQLSNTMLCELIES